MSALAVALRIARRDARRARGRSALVIAMIGLPVLGVGAADVLFRTFQLSPDQTAARQMGAADALIDDTGQGLIEQLCGSRCGWSGGTIPRKGPAPAVASVLPAGSRVLREVSDSVQVSVRDVTVNAQADDLALDDPIAQGLYVRRSGTAPRAVGEGVLTQVLAKRLGVRIGDHVSVASRSQPAHDVRVTGLLDDPSDLGTRTLIVAPGSLPATGLRRILVDAPRGLVWHDVQVANAAGFALTLRHRVPGEPTPPSVGGTALTGTAVTAISLVVGMALLEIVLLAGPAFAVGAKRQTRDLALVSASGGETRNVRHTVLAAGLVLGAAGGVLGTLGGIGLARLAEPFLVRFTRSVPGPFDLRPVELLGVVAVGVVTALLAAVLPARTAGRQDVVAALTGRRGTTRSLKRTPALGLVAALVGAAIALEGARRRSANTILAGSALAELGLVATTPFLVGMVGRLGRWLPLAPRLAVRDAARNRGRTAPAVSAILAAVAGSVAVGTYVASLDHYHRNSYQPSAPYGTTRVDLQGAGGARAHGAAAERVVSEVLPGASVMVVHALVQTPSGEAEPGYVELERVPMPECDPGSFSSGSARSRALAAHRCDFSSRTMFGTPLVGDVHTLRATTGLPDRRLDPLGRTLAGGGSVVPSYALRRDGTAVLLVHAAGETNASAARRVVLRAVALPADALQDAVLSPAAAATAGMSTAAVGVVASEAQPPTTAQEDRLRAELSRLRLDSIQTERGYHSRYGSGLLALLVGSTVIVLGASGIATGLAAADGRADLSTLAAVGASPSTRRSLAAFQSAVTAGLGTVLGAVAGLVPAVGMIRALNSVARANGAFRNVYPLVLPWTNLVVTIIVVPLVAAAAAALLTRSRLTVVRRLA